MNKMRPSSSQMRAWELPFYHPYLGGAEEVLTMMDKYSHIEGSFILRNSFSTAGGLTVSVWYRRDSCTKPQLKHFNIKEGKAGFFLQSKTFVSLDELFKFYADNDVPNEEGLHGLRLLYPILTAGKFNSFIQRRKVSAPAAVMREVPPALPPAPPPGMHLPHPDDGYEEMVDEDGYQMFLSSTESQTPALPPPRRMSHSEPKPSPLVLLPSKKTAKHKWGKRHLSDSS